MSKNKNYFKFIKGLQTTIKAQLMLVEYLNTNFSVDYILVGKTNQDGLEIFFSRLRGKGGFNYTPSSYEIGVHFANIIVIKLLFNSEYSNCFADDGNMVELEWNTFQQDYKTSLVETKEEQNIPEECEIVYDTQNTVLKDNAILYYAGYCAYKKLNCDKCRDKLLKQNDEITSTTETFITHKNYNKLKHFGSLKVPQMEYAEISRVLVAVFEQTFKKDCHLPNIVSKITEHCLRIVDQEFPGFLPIKDEGPCYEHIKNLVYFFILVLTRKNSKWSFLKGEFKNLKKKPNHRAPTQHSKKLRILTS